MDRVAKLLEKWFFLYGVALLLLSLVELGDLYLEAGCLLLLSVYVKLFRMDRTPGVVNSQEKEG